LGDGFALQMVDNGTIESCNAQENGGNGFVLDNVDTTCFKWCKANMNCFHGICDSACNGDNVYLGCIAKQNGIHGFNIAGGGKVLQECIASQNTCDGFNLTTSLLKDGDLDTTFGDDGKVTTNFGGSGNTGNAVAIQKDGKIVVAGQSNALGPFNFAIARYNVDGSLDMSFGTGGQVITPFEGGFASGEAVTIQKNGKIVVAGFANANFALVRYNTNGSLDVTFGDEGKVMTDFAGSDNGNAVALQKDGKIVVAGESDLGFSVARYNVDGSLDATFGDGGKVTTAFVIGINDNGNAVVIQKDGKIVVVGQTGPSESGIDIALVRYNTDGSLDASFGVGGKVITDFGSSGRGVALQKDGKIVVAGISGGDFILVRYNTDGSLDVNFGVGGSVITDFGGNSDFARGVMIQKDGKIVVAGQSNAGGDNDFAVARYNTDGSLDLSFGMEGKVITNFGGSDRGFAVALQKDGKIVAAGVANGATDFAVARYVVFKQGAAVKDGCLIYTL